MRTTVLVAVLMLGACVEPRILPRDDAGTSADASTDAPCTCTSGTGECCPDGCHPTPAGTPCGERITERTCRQSGAIRTTTYELRCDGINVQCLELPRFELFYSDDQCEIGGCAMVDGGAACMF